MRTAIVLLLLMTTAHGETVGEKCRRETSYVPLNLEGDKNIAAELVRHAALQKVYVACLKRNSRMQDSEGK